MTGGAGFIGSHVVAQLLERGCDEVLVVDDLSIGSHDNLHGLDVLLEQRDVASDGAYDAIVAFAPETIYHLAAQTDVLTSVRKPIEDAATNVLGTLTVADAASRTGARIVFSSTGGAMYGSVERPAREDDPPRPCSPYAVSKLAAEWYLRLRGHVCLRYGNVYGPRQLATLEGGVVAVFLHTLRQGLRPVVFGDGEQTRDFVYVRDVAEATVDARQLDCGVYNVGTGVSTRILDLLDWLGSDWEAAPERRGEVRHSVLDPAKLRAHLPRWDPRPLADGLAALTLLAT